MDHYAMPICKALVVKFIMSLTLLNTNSNISQPSLFHLGRDEIIITTGKTTNTDNKFGQSMCK